VPEAAAGVGAVNVVPDTPVPEKVPLLPDPGSNVPATEVGVAVSVLVAP
jgi:hypothetical protein